MTKQKAIDFLTHVIMKANEDIKMHQDLIDEWNDPDDIAVRASEMVKKNHQRYARAAYITIILLKSKSSN